MWIAGGSSASDLTHWPTVIQDSFDERMAAAAAEFKVAAADAVSARAEIETLTNDFNKYKARAHTALKKATSSGADDKRKDEVRMMGGVIVITHAIVIDDFPRIHKNSGRSDMPGFRLLSLRAQA